MLTILSLMYVEASVHDAEVCVMQKVAQKVKTGGLFTFTLSSRAHAAWSASETRSSFILVFVTIGCFRFRATVVMRC